MIYVTLQQINSTGPSLLQLQVNHAKKEEQGAISKASTLWQEVIRTVRPWSLMNLKKGAVLALHEAVGHSNLEVREQFPEWPRFPCYPYHELPSPNVTWKHLPLGTLIHNTRNFSPVEVGREHGVIKMSNQVTITSGLKIRLLVKLENQKGILRNLDAQKNVFIWILVHF